MENYKHKVIYMWHSVKITAHLTNAELSKLLSLPDVKLITVNAPDRSYQNKKSKRR